MTRFEAFFNFLSLWLKNEGLLSMWQNYLPYLVDFNSIGDIFTAVNGQIIYLAIPSHWLQSESCSNLELESQSSKQIDDDPFE